MCANLRMIDFSFYNNGKVFDLIDKTDRAAPLFITDYSCLDREIIIDKTANNTRFGECYQKEKIASVVDLRIKFKQLISMVQHLLENKDLGIIILGSTSVSANVREINRFPTPICGSFNFGISDVEKDLLVEQLIFDILFDKYLNESELMTRNAYSKYIAEKLYTDPIQRIDCARAINENLTRGMNSHYDMMKYSIMT